MREQKRKRIKGITAEEKIKKLNEAIEKNKLKVQNLKTGVVTKSNKKRTSKNDKNNKEEGHS